MRVLLLVGYAGSGKTTGRLHLERIGFSGFEASEYAHRRLDQHGSIEALLRLHGRDVVARDILADLPRSRSIISGFRTLEEIRLFQSKRSAFVIALQAPIRLCFERCLQRDPQRHRSFEEFIEDRIRPDDALGLATVLSLADVWVRNSTTQDEFLHELEEVASSE